MKRPPLPGYSIGDMAIEKNFSHKGHTLLYRIVPIQKPGHLWAELRILREEEALGETVFAQPQLLSYRGPGKEAVIDQMFREQAQKHYGIKIP